MPPSVPPDRPDVRRRAPSSETISSWASDPGVAASSKPSPTSTPLIAWIPISAPARRASSRRSQCTCEPRPGGSPSTTTSTTPPRVSPSLWAWSIRSTISLRGVRVQAAHGIRVETLEVVGGRDGPGGGAHPTQLDDVGHQPRPGRLLEEGGGDPTERHPGGRLPRRGALEDRTRLVEAVLLHADQVRMSRSWPGERRVAGQGLELHRVHRVGGHHLLPLGPLGVADLDRYRSTLGLAVTNATGDPDLVLLELHPGSPPVAEPSPGQRVRDVGRRHPHVGGHSLENGGQGRPVGLPGGEPAQHGAIVPRSDQ